MLVDSGQVWKEHVSTGTRWITRTFCCRGRVTRCLCCQPSIGWLSIWAPRESWSRTSSKLDLKMWNRSRAGGWDVRWHARARHAGCLSTLAGSALNGKRVVQLSPWKKAVGCEAVKSRVVTVWVLSGEDAGARPDAPFALRET